MHDDVVLHAWFIFNLHTKSHLYLHNTQSIINRTPCEKRRGPQLTWKTSVLIKVVNPHHSPLWLTLHYITKMTSAISVFFVPDNMSSRQISQFLAQLSKNPGVQGVNFQKPLQYNLHSDQLYSTLN